jgi:hypothetical protein
MSLNLAPFVRQDARRLLAMLLALHGEKTWDMPPRIADLINSLKTYLDVE